MVNKVKYIISIHLIVTIVLFSQSDSIKSKNQELTEIKKEISQLEKELKSKTKEEKESLRSIENINRQNLLLNKLINNLISEEKEVSSSIAETEAQIQTIENRISILKDKYSRYVVWVYKNRGLSILRFLFDTKSFNQTLKRYRYLTFISEENKKTLAALNNSKEELSLLKDKLEKERDQKESLVSQKLNEQTNLKEKESEKKDLIKTLKRDQKLIAEEIAAKRRAEIIIKNIITRLIEEDRIRKAKEIENKGSALTKFPVYNYSSLANFSQLKGILNWPVKEGKIVRKFGENKNVRLNTVTLNYGIDIEVGDEQNVVSVAEGIVSAIDFIPGYGSIVIVTHRDEFRTVYGHLSNISIKEGEKLTTGKVIGSVNESLEGHILHFEIWNERNYQNPEVWLARK
jgi:septal ring factor EnvC (AmiA/AmiB activator)